MSKTLGTVFIYATVATSSSSSSPPITPPPPNPITPAATAASSSAWPSPTPPTPPLPHPLRPPHLRHRAAPRGPRMRQGTIQRHPPHPPPLPQDRRRPRDGLVNVLQATREMMHRTKREMELHDKNRDGFVSFKEHEPPSWTSALQDINNASSEMGWWREDHFNASDLDGDGLLNLTEFDDTNPKLIHCLCKEEIRFLSEDELKAVIGTLHPSEHYYAKQQADYVLSQADTDLDGRLSLKEMIEHPYVFYSAIFSYDDGDDDFRDEFR